MTAAEKRRANRMRVARQVGDPQVKGSVRLDGMTGAEVLEIWSRSGKITRDRGPASGLGKKPRLRIGNGKGRS